MPAGESTPLTTVARRIFPLNDERFWGFVPVAASPIVMKSSFVPGRNRVRQPLWTLLRCMPVSTGVSEVMPLPAGAARSTTSRSTRLSLAVVVHT